MTIEFPCIGCGLALCVPDEVAGRKAQCPNCGGLVSVPRTSDADGPDTIAPPEPAPPVSQPGEMCVASPLDETVYHGPPHAESPDEVSPAASPEPPLESPAEAAVVLEPIPVGSIPRFPTAHSSESGMPAVDVNPYQTSEFRDVRREEGLHVGDQVLVLATRGRRCFAALIDGGLLALVIGVIAGLSQGADETAWMEKDSWSESFRVFALLGGLAFAGVNGRWLLKFGQTVGKRWLGIRIVEEESGRTPTWKRGLALRYAVPLCVTLVFPIFPLFDLVFLAGAHRKCLHDYFASTRVVVE